MILHLVTDEKFTDYAIKHFSAFVGSSEFVMVTYFDVPLRYLQLAENVRVVRYKSEEYQQLLDFLPNYTTVLSHGLFESWQHEIILAAPSSVKVAWMCWGGELYGLPQCRMQFLSLSAKFLYYTKRFIHWLKGIKDNAEISRVPLSVFQRIDYCLTDEREECDFANQLLGTNMRHLWYNYYSIEETIGALADSQVNGMNILLGNSSTFESNHIMVLRKLRKMDLDIAQIILPLSYGDSWLRARLIQWGKLFIPKHYSALTTFMPREEYNRIMQSCGVVVMPHYRPQAFGNILTALWMGAKVFLSEKNIVYPFYKRLGLHFYTIENDLTQEQISTHLPEESILHNRAILLAEYSAESMFPRVKSVVEELNT